MDTIFDIACILFLLSAAFFMVTITIAFIKELKDHD